MTPRQSSRARCMSRTKVTAGLLLSFLTLSTPTRAAVQAPAFEPFIPPQAGVSHDFSLRHVFHRGTYQDPNLHKRFDVRLNENLLLIQDEESPQIVQQPRFAVRSSSAEVERLRDRRSETIEQYLQYAGHFGRPVTLGTSDWTVDKVEGPDVKDKDTVINLAMMAANAYSPTAGEGDWANVSLGYNESQSFGWEGDGLRGHIFADETNSTIIVSLKGTSPAVFDGDGTTTRDKLNDNLFFSCCCGQGGQYFWRQVCDCATTTYTCNQTCVIKALKNRTRYYSAAIDLYTNVTALYPDSNMWVVGHSLGGAVSSLLGQTFGLPVVTYEAPGDDMAARRLGLPYKPDEPNPYRGQRTAVWHFGHTADPVFMGTCNTATSTCTLGGYAMESQCHTGKQCVYDTVTDMGWRSGIGYHKIHNVIETVLKKYDKVPACEPDTECVDCYNWKYFDSNGSDSTTTRSTMSTTSKTATRTATCKTPGWWGCLDETTTPHFETTTITTTSCAKPGWFGCNKSTTLTLTTTTMVPRVPASATPILSTSTSTSLSTTTTTSVCQTPGLFFGCRDKQHTTHTESTTINEEEKWKTEL